MITAEMQQLVTFRIGEDELAVDIFAVERVLRFTAPAAVPNLPAWIDGVIEHGGRIVPVIDLRARFGMPRVAPGPERRIIVMSVGDDWLGVAVDAVHEVMAVPPDDVAPPPPLFRGLAAEYVRGLVRRDGALIIFLDVTRVLTSTERLELTAAAVARG
jgi:purine-binding chemotaxis protein CheW